MLFKPIESKSAAVSTRRVAPVLLIFSSPLSKSTFKLPRRNRNTPVDVRACLVSEQSLPSPMRRRIPFQRVADISSPLLLRNAALKTVTAALLSEYVA